jgi:hypothetical protein
MLLPAMTRLIGTNALTSSLSTDSSLSQVERDHIMQANGATADGVEADFMGREGYVKWEMDRILQSITARKRANAEEVNAPTTPGGYKRRKTEEVRYDDDDITVTGKPSDLSALAQSLQQG